MSIKKIFLLTFAALSALQAHSQEVTGGDDTEPADTTATQGDSAPTSTLVMPNAFSPNDDQINDTYKPKQFTNIEEFHAIIYNRWGQRLYEWSNPADDGWDGCYRGKPVKQGTYFVLVKARGTDGQQFTIRKDVNLLRGYTQDTTSE